MQTTFQFLALCWLASTSCYGEEKAPEAKIQKIDENNFTIGKVALNKKEQTLSFPITLGDPVIIGKGEDIIEYLIVNTHGKSHETLFLTEAKPFNINVAMKLLGYKPSKELFPVVNENHELTGKMHEVPYDIQQAARFDIFVEWTEKEEKRSHHINEFIFNSVSKKHAKVLPFIYCGSYLIDGAFQADIDGDLISILTNPAALGNFSNEGRNDDTIWYPNIKRLPKKDQSITIVFKKHKTLEQ